MMKRPRAASRISVMFKVVWTSLDDSGERPLSVRCKLGIVTCRIVTVEIPVSEPILFMRDDGRNSGTETRARERVVVDVRVLFDCLEELWHRVRPFYVPPGPGDKLLRRFCGTLKLR